jgi:mono/diheme cytochrome c family protein
LAALGVLLHPGRALPDIESVRAATPPELRDRSNPLEPSTDDLARGQELYAANCALCHGEDGGGHGPASRTLHPRPLDFTDATRMKQVRDGELFFAISRGSHGTAMPAFGDRLDDEDVWRLVAYVRTFSKTAEEPHDEGGD